MQDGKADGDSDPLACFWPLLVDPSNAVGAARLASQYFRANVDPSERYTCRVK